MKNKVNLIGRLGRDPEVKYMQNGEAAVNISIVTYERWKDKNTGEQKENTEWHNCVAYRRLAEIIGEYLKKGDLIDVEGKLRTRKWQDKDTGQDRYSTEIIINEMLMMPKGSGQTDGGAQSSNRAPQQQQQASQNQYAQQAGGEFDDSDIPF